MFKYLLFNSESVMIGLLVAVIVALILFFIVRLLGKNHNVISLAVVLVITVLFFVIGVLFSGMASSKSMLLEYQTTTMGYAQQLTDQIANYSPRLSEFLATFSEGISAEYVANQCQQITKYQWLTGILGVLFLIIGAIAAYYTADAPRSAGRGRSSRTHRDGGERVSRSHRSHY